jgi:hypothetical protein
MPPVTQIRAPAIHNSGLPEEITSATRNEPFRRRSKSTQRRHKGEFFAYLAIRQANNTTAAPAAAAITDVTSPLPSASKRAT